MVAGRPVTPTLTFTFGLTLTLILLCALPITRTTATAGLGRIQSFLGRRCGDFAEFLRASCRSPGHPPCCAMFSLVDVCRTLCGGPSSASVSGSLQTLLKDPALCSHIKLAGKQFCELRPSKKCDSLLCVMNLICFQVTTSCDDDYRHQPPTEASSRHVNSRNFELPEIAACESTNLLEFDPKNVRVCPPVTVTQKCPSNTLTYRTIDGSCNNLDHPDWGRSFQPVKRYLPPAYDDGQQYPRTLDASGGELNSVRYISRYICPERSSLSDLSVVNMAWGQFLDHDITGFPVFKVNDTDIQCCKANLEPEMFVDNGGPCFPIAIDEGDDFFRGQNCMEFARSTAAMDENDYALSPREQVNALTSYVDGSSVYGSTLEVMDKLRVPGGKLLVAANNMLPSSGKSNCKIVENGTDYCLLAGDHRVNVFVGLGIFHTTFHRGHNQLVDGLADVNPHWNSERLFQEARKIVSALLQHVTYNEYLPSFLNDATMSRYHLKTGHYFYDSTVNPNMANVFSTAAFRFGHSQIQRFVQVGIDRFKMENTLMRPHLVLTRFDDVVEGLAFYEAEEVDQFFVDAVTDRLFEKTPSMRDGLDLVALNTQRGRDHGLPSYNSFREFCNLAPVTTFDSPVFPPDNKLSHVYRSVDDIDVFIGGVAERPLPNSAVGPLFACLIGQQFHDIKVGDRFFYETSSRREGFSTGQLSEIRKQSLSSILCAYTGVKSLQRDLMFIPDPVSNPVINCNQAVRIDLRHWQEMP